MGMARAHSRTHSHREYTLLYYTRLSISGTVEDYQRPTVSSLMEDQSEISLIEMELTLSATKIIHVGEWIFYDCFDIIYDV